MKNRLIVSLIILFLAILPIEVFSPILTFAISKAMKIILMFALSILILIYYKNNSIRIDYIVIYQISYLFLTFSILLFQDNASASLVKWIQYLIVYLFYFSIIQMNLNEINILYKKRIENIIIGMFLLNIFVGYFQMNYNLFWSSHVSESVTGYARPVGLFNNSNGLGGFMVIVTLYLLWCITNHKKMKYMVLFIIGVYGLFLTGSEGSQISFIIGTTIFLSSFNNIVFRLLKILFIGSGVLIVLSLLLSKTVQDTAILILENQARYDLWFISIEVFKGNWLFGIGDYNFFNKITEYGFVSKYGAIPPHPHNIILDFLVSYGILGALMVLCIVFYISLKYIKYSPSIDPLRVELMVIVYLIQALIHDFVDGGFLIGTSSVAILLLFMIAHFKYFIPDSNLLGNRV